MEDRQDGIAAKTLIASLARLFASAAASRNVSCKSSNLYPDAGHAFENPRNKDAYRPADTGDAWKRTIALLADTLKAEAPGCS